MRGWCSLCVQRVLRAGVAQEGCVCWCVEVQLMRLCLKKRAFSSGFWRCVYVYIYLRLKCDMSRETWV